ncbi:MAG: GTP 3',8-cyclase MoaA [Omnitrophica bacterium]|nr:GTP 3',8-cyclase MoaA [Candidatus Omnitrophota bacterium]
MSINKSNRRIDYLRISVTDRCNLRCSYCMPAEGIETVRPEELLNFEEIARLVNIFVNLGIKKVRITGGEPLVRKGLPRLLKAIANTKGIEEIALTTNGVLLPQYTQDLKEAGVRRLNISLDTLKEEKFKRITLSPYFYNVMAGIDKARELRFDKLKLNTVVMKGINDDEIIDFVKFAKSKSLILRFIEFMRVTPLWKEDLFIPIEEIKKICEKKYKLERMENPGPSPAEHYKVDGRPLLGFIKTDQNNCNRCSRLRLTSVGNLKICLYENEGLSLKEFLRDRSSDREIFDMVRDKISLKEQVNYNSWQPANTYMCSLGG